ncbi:MAG: bifunctional precorrin-2 dehydrogenase/sirohydrochlorin ferrochelatase [Eubacterium sp.]|nr:bifunctional precorrin-2 dehydrogenase/sirohydrochlorin ferrochelatase [Eubacterium sp.]
MGYFPFFMDMERLQGLIIGGGNIAAEKLEKLLPAGASLKVVAPEIKQEILVAAGVAEIKGTAEQQNADREPEGSECTEPEKPGRVEVIRREYRTEDLDEVDYVIAATGIREINDKVCREAKQRRIPVNVVDDPENCDFIFPSVVRRGRMVVGVSTGGAGPRVAVRLRKQIEEMLPGDIEEILDILARERIRAKKEIPDSSRRKKYLMDLADRLLAGDN